MTTRLLTWDDLDACGTLAATRNWGREEHKWRLLFELGEAWGIDAPDGDGLAATAVLVGYGHDTAVISMVLTAERYERQGFASRVMTRVLERAGGRVVSLHATEFGRPVYERLGFTTVGKVASRTGVFTGGAAGTTRAFAESDLPGILKLDADVFGTDRAELLRRMPVFHERVRVLERGGRVAGYGGAWRNDASVVIGPVVAQDLGQAQELIADLATGWDLPVRMDMDTRQEGLMSWAAERGVESGFLNSLMVRGGDIPGDRSRQFLPAMVALG
ncbi:GNAT family N-acetyltransferase [Nonomuraea sp. NBC_01738]|uniref:GNAT family N-acetyltransferase n=1 Tax=Nonomuraea sp. NBC_01738 TaxID=2976003 RepID=UPI002E0F6885|nr:GNAT family N-acetyltransferase [Nonomuraea sp. NBC_01738]